MSNTMQQPYSAFHGGKSFEAIGDDFADLDRAERIINADVLDAWFDPSPRVLKKLRAFLPFIARTSPPIYAAGLVAAIETARGLPSGCVLIGGGSSGLIFTCFPHLINAAQKALILDPMYGEYRHILSEVIGAQVIPFDLRQEEEFRIDTDALIAKVRDVQPDLIALVNPNSPTGRHWPRAEVVRFLNHLPDSVTVVIDETYIEYAGLGESLEKEACDRPNLIVLKSMSKVYALGGLRVGYLVANPSIVRPLARWIPPWAVSLPAQVAAIEALSDAPYYERQYRETARLRAELICDLRRSSFRVYPSMTNSMLIETQSSAQGIVETLRKSDIFVRNCDSMGLRFADRFLRIAVKRQFQNIRIVEALRAASELATSRAAGQGRP